MSGKTAAVGAVAGGLVDQQLVAAVRVGDDRAFEELYTRYHPRIASYVRGMVKDHARAEDVTQEIFLSALRRMRETERPIAFKPWVYEIARNACIDQYRRGSRAEELSYDAEGALCAADHGRLASADLAPEVAIDAKQRLDHLCGAFGGLSETHHRILVLRELEGLSYREIGEQLGMTRPAVESTLFRARRRLSEEYDDLVSGRRCARVQSVVGAAAEGMLGPRERRGLNRHLASCQPCRREARLMGVEFDGSRGVAARLAALLPFPLLDGGREGGGRASSFVGQVWSALGTAGEPVASWAKAMAAAAAVAVAGIGAGAVAPVGPLALPALPGGPITKALKRAVEAIPGVSGTAGGAGASGARPELGGGVRAALGASGVVPAGADGGAGSGSPAPGEAGGTAGVGMVDAMLAPDSFRAPDAGGPVSPGGSSRVVGDGVPAGETSSLDGVDPPGPGRPSPPAEANDRSLRERIRNARTRVTPPDARAPEAPRAPAPEAPGAPDAPSAPSAPEAPSAQPSQSPGAGAPDSPATRSATRAGTG